jgi:hypothetical protein
LEFMREPNFPFCDNLCDAIAATAFTFPPPRGTLPAEQRADDMDRIVDHYTCFDDPLMRDFISSLGDSHRNVLNTQVDMARKRIPAFPPSFRIWDTMPGHNLSIRSSYSLCHNPRCHSYILLKGILGRDEKKAPQLQLKLLKTFLRPSVRREHKYEAL